MGKNVESLSFEIIADEKPKYKIIELTDAVNQKLLLFSDK